MSFILDALNRSDTDRDQEQSVPGLQTVHGPGTAVVVPLWRRVLWPALALVFALVAAGAWLSNPGSPDSAPAPTPAPEATAVPASPAPASPRTETVAPAPQVAVRQSPPRPSSGQQADIAALYANKPSAPAATVASAPAAVATTTPQPQPVIPEPAASEPAAPTRRPTEVAEPAIDVDALARAAQAELDSLQTEREPVVEHEAPYVNELRQSVKDQIPSIFYNAHNWSANPGQRSVILNKREFREGQQVKPGLKLVEILQDGIVLDFRGTEFRLNSLNSWVNL